VPRPAPALIHTPAAPALAAAAAAGSPMPSQLLPSHRKAVIDTHSNVIKNLKEYRTRNETTMSWWEEHYPDYYKKVVFHLSPEMKAMGHDIITKQHEICDTTFWIHSTRRRF